MTKKIFVAGLLSILCLTILSPHIAIAEDKPGGIVDCASKVSGPMSGKKYPDTQTAEEACDSIADRHIYTVGKIIDPSVKDAQESPAYKEQVKTDNAKIEAEKLKANIQNLRTYRCGSDASTNTTTDTSSIAGVDAASTPPSSSSFLGFPTWYKYLKSGEDGCPTIDGIQGVWAIVVAVIEFMMRLAVMLSVGLVIWGGIKMITSEGEPENFAKARKIVINSLVGLVITIVATGLVNFVGNQFKG